MTLTKFSLALAMTSRDNVEAFFLLNTEQRKCDQAMQKCSSRGTSDASGKDLKHLNDFTLKVAKTFAGVAVNW